MTRILVIDDEPDILIILKKILSSEGHHVDTASDGNVGLRLLEAHSYDLVITDIVMPDSDGFEVLMAMNKKYPDIKRIVISGGTARLDQHALISTAKNFRPNKVIAKPIDYEKFSEVVKELLDT
jgi:CheY-like chemotaxis protein